MHVMDDLSSLNIRSLQGDYPVEFSQSIREVVERLLEFPEALVVCDRNIADLYWEQLSPVTSTRPTRLVTADEEAKSLSGVADLVGWLIEQNAVRSTTVIAIGGGCIQDLVSFTTHIYFRGIRWVFVPTTVLSQADSCIGAKSGINVLPYKNQLGAMHSPRHILISTEFLITLPDVEIASGYGEIVKLSVTSNRHFLDVLHASLADGGLRNPHLLALTRASLAAKQEIIEQDEYESDLRRILNYGHTFGHALEALAGHGVPHGLAVLWGIDIINRLGVMWNITDANTAEELTTLISTHFDYRLPIDPGVEDLLDMVGRDKKVSEGRIHFAVLIRPGEFVIEPRPIDAVLAEQLARALNESRVFRRP